MRRALLRTLALAFLAALLLVPTQAQATQVAVRATLDPPVIGAGETTTLTLEARSGGLTNVGFTAAFALDNFEVVGGPLPSGDITIINGSLSRTYRMTWRLRAATPGPARVRGIELHLLGQTVHLRDQEIRVAQEPTGNGGFAAPPTGSPLGLPNLPDPEEVIERMLGRPALREPQPSAPAAFLRSEVVPARPLAGEQAIYTLYLYTRRDIAAVSPDALPTFHGFWVRDIPLPQQLPSELADIGGVRYSRLPLLRKALFALRAGAHQLEQATVDVGIQNYASDLFAAPFAQTEQVRLAAPPLAVEVQPLPPAPPGFGSTVGQYQLSATATPPFPRVGEAVTVTVRLSGAGNLSSVHAPTLEAPAAISVLPPEQKSHDRLAGSTVEGERVWTYALVPRHSGHFAVRVDPVPYFDPAAHTYRLALTAPLSVNAVPNPVAAALVPVKSRVATREEHPTSSVTRTAVVGSTLAVGLLLVTVLARRRRPGGRLESPAAAVALDRNLALALVESQPRRAAALVEEGWRHFIGGPTGLPPAVAGGRRWREAARGNGWDGHASSELAQIAEEISYLRQAPQLSVTDELRRELVARSRGLLRALGH